MSTSILLLHFDQGVFLCVIRSSYVAVLILILYV